MTLRVYQRKPRKQLTWEQLALELYKDGSHIIYCDLECVAKSVHNLAPSQNAEPDYYLIDECGNQVWIDPAKYEVLEE